MEIWDAYYRDETLAGKDLIRGEEIPDGLYHLVCDVIVKHKDGDFLLMQRDKSKECYGGYYEATAGGSALKGEDKYACIKRELFEETGIKSENFKELVKFTFDKGHCFFYSFLCEVDCDKDSIVLQKGETIGYKWVNKEEFKKFLRSKDVIPTQKYRFMGYYFEENLVELRN